MMEKKKWLTLSVAALVASVITLIAPIVIGACACGIETAAGGQVPMKCHWTERALILVSLIPVMTTVFQLFLKEKSACVISSGILLISAVVLILLTTDMGIGVCATSGMSCGTMALVVRIAMVFAGIVAIVQMICTVGNGNKPKRGF